MKISPETLQILKNFSSINNGIFVKKGSKLSTISPQKNIMGVASIQEVFPTEFGIYDINNFLSVLTLYKDNAELEFDSKHIIIKGMGGRSKIKYRFTDPSMIVSPPDKSPVLPSSDVKFDLSKDDFDWLMKTASVLDSPNIAVEGVGNDINLISFDQNNDSAHTNSICLDGLNSAGVDFKIIFSTDNLKVVPGNYSIEISSAGISKFSNKEIELNYWIAIETTSKF